MHELAKLLEENAYDGHGSMPQSDPSINRFRSAARTCSARVK
jgi:hypothetical protein